MNIPWSPAGAPLCYLASPFTLYRYGPKQAVEDVASVAAQLLKAGMHLFCPVTHGWPLITSKDSPLDPYDGKLWAEINAPFLRVCDVLLVGHFDGWRDSSGIAGEVEYFERAGKPIWDLDPETLLMQRRSSFVLAHDKTAAEMGGASA